jgi:hypothetical protein
MGNVSMTWRKSQQPIKLDKGYDIAKVARSCVSLRVLM